VVKHSKEEEKIYIPLKRLQRSILYNGEKPLYL
jgi:hypothetical protein